jgi:membrane dipeptidase
MRFFDAHCDTIGPILEAGADFLAEPRPRAAAAARGADPAPPQHPAAAGGPRPQQPAPIPHVTLPAMRAGRMGAQVFASWVWSAKYRGTEFETGMDKVEGVRKLCADHPDQLFLASTGADLAGAFPASGPEAAAPGGEATLLGPSCPAADDRVAVLPSLEGSDSLAGDVDNLFAFYDAGVRLLTLAWDDTPFCGSSYGDGPGLSKKGVDLVAACESLGVVVDVSHLSDQGFADLCDVAERPFVASHSNCRSLCPSPRNLTDDMIRTLAERGGVMGITLAPGFLSAEYCEKERASTGAAFQAVRSGAETFEDAERKMAGAMAGVALPPLALLVDHVKWAIDKGGEDCVGLGGDLDGVDFLPAGFAGVEDYPRIEALLRAGGLTPRQVDKVCYENFLRVFGEILG